jgi:hypothetical protein
MRMASFCCLPHVICRYTSLLPAPTWALLPARYLGVSCLRGRPALVMPLYSQNLQQLVDQAGGVLQPDQALRCVSGVPEWVVEPMRRWHGD